MSYKYIGVRVHITHDSTEWDNVKYEPEYPGVNQLKLLQNADYKKMLNSAFPTFSFVLYSEQGYYKDKFTEGDIVSIYLFDRLNPSDEVHKVLGIIEEIELEAGEGKKEYCTIKGSGYLVQLGEVLHKKRCIYEGFEAGSLVKTLVDEAREAGETDITTEYVEETGAYLGEIDFPYKPLLDCLLEIKKRTQNVSGLFFDLFVDVNKRLHFAPRETGSPVATLTDLKVSSVKKNIFEVKNKVFVTGAVELYPAIGDLCEGNATNTQTQVCCCYKNEKMAWCDGSHDRTHLSDDVRQHFKSRNWEGNHGLRAIYYFKTDLDRANASQIKIHMEGHTINRPDCASAIWNFSTNTWESLQTQIPSGPPDAIREKTLTSNLTNYINTAGEIRIKFEDWYTANAWELKIDHLYVEVTVSVGGLTDSQVWNGSNGVLSNISDDFMVGGMSIKFDRTDLNAEAKFYYNKSRNLDWNFDPVEEGRKRISFWLKADKLEELRLRLALPQVGAEYCWWERPIKPGSVGTWEEFEFEVGEGSEGWTYYGPEAGKTWNPIKAVEIVVLKQNVLTDVIHIDGLHYETPIIVSASDANSIAEYGLREKEPIDGRTESKEAAQQIADRLLALLKDPKLTIKAKGPVHMQIDVGDAVFLDLPDLPEIFSDGFETGDFSAWTGWDEEISVVSEEKHCGAYCAKAVTSGVSYVYKTWGSGKGRTMYCRVYFMMPSLPSNGRELELCGLYCASPSAATGTIGLKNDAGTYKIALNYRHNGAWGTVYSSGITIAANEWHCVVLKLVVSTNGQADGLQIGYYDGANVVSVSDIDNDDRGSEIIGCRTPFIESGEETTVYIDCVKCAVTGPYILYEMNVTFPLEGEPEIDYTFGSEEISIEAEIAALQAEVRAKTAPAPTYRIKPAAKDQIESRADWWVDRFLSNQLFNMASGYFAGLLPWDFISQLIALAKVADGFFTATATAKAKFSDGIWALDEAKIGAVLPQPKFSQITDLVKLADALFAGTAGLAKYGSGFWSADVTGRGKFADSIWLLDNAKIANILPQSKFSQITDVVKLATSLFGLNTWNRFVDGFWSTSALAKFVDSIWLLDGAKIANILPQSKFSVIVSQDKLASNLVTEPKHSVGTSNTSTNSTSFVDYEAMSITFTGLPDCVLVIFFSSTTENYDADAHNKFRICIDDVEKIKGAVQFKGVINDARCCALFWAESVAAGNHTVKVQWKVDLGTATCTKGTYPEEFHRELVVIALKR